MKKILTLLVLLTLGIISDARASFPGDSMSLAILWNEQYVKQKNIDKLSKVDQIGYLLKEASPDIAKAIIMSIEDDQIKGKLSKDTEDSLRKEVLFEYLSSKYFYENKKQQEKGMWDKVKSFFSFGAKKEKSEKNQQQPKGFIVIMPPYIANNIDNFSEDEKQAVTYLSHILDENDFELIYDAKTPEERQKIIKELLKDYYIDDKVDNTEIGTLRQIFMIPIF